MKLEFNSEVDGPKEAAALTAALAVLHGPAVADALDNAADRIEVGAVTIHAPENFDPSKLADDGRPETDTSAADAFGGGQPAPGSVAAPTVDTAGIPWDERIHSGTKGTNKDGTWSRRRNTPDEVFDKVMAELKSGGTGGPLSEPASPASTTPVDPNTSTPVASPTNEAPPPPPPPPAPNAPAASVSFPQLMVKITKAQTGGKIDKATVDGFLASFGLDKIAALATAGADTIAAVNAMVDEHVGGGQ